MSGERSEEGEGGMMEQLQRASDEAIELIYEMFGMSSKGQGQEGGATGPKQSFSFVGNLEGFNATSFAESAKSEWGMFYNSVMGFVTAVHWTEPWIICLGIFHMTLLIAVFATRTNSNLQIGLFGFVLSLVYFAETINGIATENWKSFSEQNYFDKNGMFLSVVWSTPLLLIAVVMLFMSLYSALQLMIQVKRQQIKAQIKAARKEEGAGAAESKKSR